MGVLAGWNGKSILDGVLLLQRRRGALELLQGWSIAELMLDDDDRQKLWGWYGGLTRQELDDHLELGGALVGASVGLDPENIQRERTCSKEEAIGLLLLAALAEQARYAGEIRKIWPAILRLKVNGPARDLLFHGNGQPTPALRAALREAATFFQIRNVFDDEEPRQAWATTLSLQYIFPVLDTKTHLAEWLVGHPHPLALQRVLQDSSTFRDCWKKILQSRKRRDTNEIRTLLGQCCWFGGHDVHELSLEAIRQVTAPAAITEADESGDEEDFSSEILLDEPRLRWAQEGTPELCATVRPLLFSANVGTAIKKAFLAVNGDRRSWLYLRNGQLETLQPTEVVLPWQDEVVAALVEPAQQTLLASQLLSLRRSSIEVFELSGQGRRLASMPVRDTEIALWLPPGAKVSPDFPLIPVESGGLVVLPAPWPDLLEISVGGQLLWRWRRQSAPQPQPPPCSPQTRRPGLHVRSASGEQWVDTSSEVELRSLELAPVRIVLPQGMDTATLMAGGRAAGRIRLRPSPLRGLMGLGEPLVALHHEQEVPLVHSVVDHGVISSFENDGTSARLHLAVPLELDSDFSVVVWPVSGLPRLLPCKGGPPGEGVTRIDLESDLEFRALGLAYRGALLGSWWRDGWARDLELCSLEPQQVLLLLCWLRLPLLQGVDAPAAGCPYQQISRFAREHLDDVLVTWGCFAQYEKDQGPSSNLRLDHGTMVLKLAMEERWLVARKELALDRSSALLSSATSLSRAMSERLFELYLQRLYQRQAQAMAPFFDALLKLGPWLPAALDVARHGTSRNWANQFRMFAAKWPIDRGFKAGQQRTVRRGMVEQLLKELGFDSQQLAEELLNPPRAQPLSRRFRSMLHRENFARLLAFESCKQI